MRLKLTPPNFEEFDAAAEGAGDKDLAVRLTHLIQNLDHSTVAVFDGRWGIGKTTFIKRWLAHLAAEGIPSIYVDSFAVDYLESPFVAIAGAFSQAAERANKSTHPTYTAFVAAASKVGKTLGGTAAKIAIKAATFGVIGSSELEGLSNVGEAIADAVGDRAEEAVKELIQEHSRKENELATLKGRLSEFPQLLSIGSEEKNASKLVVVIDELDRCRPDFALGMVEAVKHFFGAENVHFVLVTNREHLVRSVEHRYGSFKAADEYLRKFYDFQVFYEQSYIRHSPSQILSFVSRLAKELLGDIPERNDIEQYARAIAIAHRLTFRDLENIFSNLSLAYAAVRPREFRPAVLVLFLAVLKTLDPTLYTRAKAGTLSFSELSVRLFNTGDWGETNVDRLRKAFQYHMDRNLDERAEEWRGWSGELWNYNLERLAVIPYLCNSILDRFALAQSNA